MAYKKLGQCILDFTIKWMDFIIQKCRKGRGARPRWLNITSECSKAVSVLHNQQSALHHSPGGPRLVLTS